MTPLLTEKETVLAAPLESVVLSFKTPGFVLSVLPLKSMLPAWRISLVILSRAVTEEVWIFFEATKRFSEFTIPDNSKTITDIRKERMAM